jgi:arylsulfatase
MIGHRGFYRDGWEIVTLHQPFTPFADSEWELYDLTNDRTELNDLAAAEPEKLAELISAWNAAAWEGQVFPLDEGTGLKYMIRPPRNEVFQEPLEVWPGTPTLERWRSLQLIWLRSFRMQAPITVGESTIGTIASHGDQSGGYALYVVEGLVPLLVFNDGRGTLTKVTGPALDPGEHLIECDFEAIGNNRWRLSLIIDGLAVDEHPEVPLLYAMSPFEGISVGRDPRSPVWWERHETHGSFQWQGTQGPVRWVPGPRVPDQPEDLVGLLRSIGAKFE